MPGDRYEVQPSFSARRGPSRGFWIGMGGVLMFALVLTGIGAVGASWEVERAALPEGSETPIPTIQVSHAPHYEPTTPPDNFTRDLGE